MSYSFRSNLVQHPDGAFDLRTERGRRTILLTGATVALGVLAAAVGSLIAAEHLMAAIFLCVALPMVFIVAWAGPSVIAALIVVLTLNGVPGINLASFNVHGSFESIDICAAALILFAGARHFLGARERSDRSNQQLAIWSIVFLVVWMFAFFKGLDRMVPSLKAALFGRDFLFFALLVPTTKALVKNEKELRRFIIAIGALTTIYALGEIATTLGAISPNLINDRKTLALGSLTRVYSPMNDLVALGFSCAAAYALLNSGKRARWAAAVAGICGIAVVLQLTRALYIGLIVGLVIACLVWMGNEFPLRAQLRRRLSWSVAGILAFAVIAVFVVPEVVTNSSVQTIARRITEGVSDVGSSNHLVRGNTVAYRQNLSSLMLHVLGQQWLLGLGFLHPAVVYFPELPHGSIRNNDLGVFNVLMTMGVVGTILIYIPVFIGLRRARPRRSLSGPWDWLRLGGMIWMISVITGSLTLVTLFSPNGLVLMAVLLGVVLRATRCQEAQATEQPVATALPSRVRARGPADPRHTA